MLQEHLIKQLGLSTQQILRHQRRIQNLLRDPDLQAIRVVDTCRLDNGGILPSHWHDRIHSSGELKPLVGFIPAAGAASRYFSPFAALDQALNNHNRVHIERALELLKIQNAHQWLLPKALQKFIIDPPQALTCPDHQLTNIKNILSAPKALLPCTSDHMSFLAMKAQEHEHLVGMIGQTFVTPAGKSHEFAGELAQQSLTVPVQFVEQGPDLSTIRFADGGNPFVDTKGQYSLVPAGHGTLVDVFPKVLKRFPNAEGVLIRNIDNVTGTHATELAALHLFLDGFSKTLSLFQSVRRLIAQDLWTEADALAREFLAHLNLHPLTGTQVDWLATKPANVRSLWQLQAQLIQMQPEQVRQLSKGDAYADLRALYERPVNILGQVPNTQNDVGGSPVFVQSRQGPLKVCLELPHASAEDVKNFFANPQKATHFNAVCVGAELISNSHIYDQEDSPFWIMASKTFQGQKVFYHETVLYELLGNNTIANALFVEIPRSLFNPHKALTSSPARASREWIPEN